MSDYNDLELQEQLMSQLEEMQMQLSKKDLQLSEALDKAESLYLELKNQKRQTVIVNGSIPNPTTDEIMRIRRNHYTGVEQMIADLQMNIQYPVSPVLQAVLCRAFAEVMKLESRRSILTD